MSDTGSDNSIRIDTHDVLGICLINKRSYLRIMFLTEGLLYAVTLAICADV